MPASKNIQTNEFTDWLAQNIQNVKNGGASYQGERVTLTTEAQRYFTCFSIVFFTTRIVSPYFLPGTDAERRTAMTATLITLLAGWWGIPFGVVLTPYYLFRNLTGGEKITVEKLISMIENPAEALKANEDFRFGPLKVVLGVFGAIIALMVLLQGYLIFTGKSDPHSHPFYTHGSSPLPAPASIAKPSATDAPGIYMAGLQHHLKAQWYPPKSNNSSRVVVTFTIDSKGHASKARLKEPSTEPGMNEAALNAIKKAEPYPPLPAVLKPSVDIQFTFDYNVFERGKKVPVDQSK